MQQSNDSTMQQSNDSTMQQSNASTILMRGITKRFPGVVANDAVIFEARAGEIHALLGENGAGKTTLMNILYGIYQPDAGDIFIKGQRVTIRSPRDAIHLGIGMVHQQFRLVPTHTVAENIVLGLPGDLIVSARAISQQIEPFAQKYGLRIDPHAYVWQLSAGEQQRVEIIKALYRGAEILILDEPTSMLTPREAQDLMDILRRMAAEGKTIIFITHKLDEVTAISHRVTVLRQGRVVTTQDTATTDARTLARWMVGRDVLFHLDKRPMPATTTVLRVEHLHALNDKGLPAVKDVSFEVKAGEILGIAGVAGNGQRELIETLVGLRPATQGCVFLNDQDVTHLSPRAHIERGMGYIPGERMSALVPSLGVAENLILKTYRQPPITRGWFLDRAVMNAHADQLIAQYGVVTPHRHTPVKLLSGGNVQRVLLAREIASAPHILIAVHPTSGLDVGATEYIWQLLLAQREQGKAVLLVSEDLEEVLALSDRVSVLFEGRLMGTLPIARADLETLGLMMAGVPCREVG